MPRQSFYLEPNRLSDLLAAIQAMGSDENFRQNCERWVRIISGPQAREDPIEDPINDQTDDKTDDQTDDKTDDKTDDQTDDKTDDKTKEQTNHWKTVFDQHPEFFRCSRKKGKEQYSLIWRRALPIALIETGKPILLRHYRQLPPGDKKKYWRPALTDSAVQTLMAIAIEMHARAVAAKRDWRWWVPYAVMLVGASVTAGFGLATVLFRGKLLESLGFGPG